MTKALEKSNFKRNIKEQGYKILNTLSSSLDTIDLDTYIRTILHPKRRMRRYLFLSALLVSGMIIILLGISLYLAFLLPVLENGLSHVIVGFLVLALAFAVYKFRR